MEETLQSWERIPDPTKGLKIVIEPSEGYQGGELVFSGPVHETISMLVTNVLMVTGALRRLVSSGKEKAERTIEVVSWEKDTRELTVKLKVPPSAF